MQQTDKHNLYMIRLRSWPEGVLVIATGSEDGLRTINRPGWTLARTSTQKLWSNLRGPSRVIETMELHVQPAKGKES